MQWFSLIIFIAVCHNYLLFIYWSCIGPLGSVFFFIDLHFGHFGDFLFLAYCDIWVFLVVKRHSNTLCYLFQPYLVFDGYFCQSSCNVGNNSFSYSSSNKNIGLNVYNLCTLDTWPILVYDYGCGIDNIKQLKAWYHSSNFSFACHLTYL